MSISIIVSSSTLIALILMILSSILTLNGSSSALRGLKEMDQLLCALDIKGAFRELRL